MNHGSPTERSATIEGELVGARRGAYCHLCRFTNTSQNAIVKQIRTFLAPLPAA